MDEYSITYPMRAPLLESTAVVAEDWETSRNSQSVEIEEEIASPELHSATGGNSDHNSKLAFSLEHSSSVSESSKSEELKSKGDSDDDYLDSFFDDHVHSIAKHIPASVATEQLCERGCASGSSVSTHVSKKVPDTIDSKIQCIDNASSDEEHCCKDPDVAGILGIVEESDCDDIEQDSLDLSASTQPQISPEKGHESRNCVTTQNPVSLLECDSTQESKNGINIGTHKVLRKVNKSGRTDSTNTFSVSSMESSCASASPTRREVSGQPLEAGGPPVKTAILRFRLDPVTNEFEEVVPAVTNIRACDSSGSSTSDHHSAPRAASEETMSPWEVWLLKKIRQDLERQRLLKYEMLRRESEEAKVREMRSKKLKQAAVVHDEWVRKKNADERSRRRVVEEETRLQQETHYQKRQMTQIKASASFIEWKKRKGEEQERLVEKMKEQAKLKELEQKEVREKADHAYKVWLRTVGCKRIEKELLYQDTHRNYVFSYADKNRLRKWHFY